MRYYKIEIQEENGGRYFYLSSLSEVTHEVVREFLNKRIDFDYSDFTIRRITEIEIYSI